MIRLLLRFVANVAAIWVAAKVLDGVSYGSDAGTLALAALVLTAANALVKPVVTFLAIPLIILTLGIALFFVSLGMLALTALLVNGFSIDDFGSAIAATIIVWLVNVVFSAVTGDMGRDRDKD